MANTMHRALIYQYPVDDDFRRTCCFDIGGMYLREPLLRQVKTNQPEITASGAACYRFFADSDWEQGVVVYWAGEEERFRTAPGVINRSDFKSERLGPLKSDRATIRLLFGWRYLQREEALDRQAVLDLSRFVRNSESLSERDFNRRSDDCLYAADARGLAVADASGVGRDKQIVRLSIVLALFAAYESAIDHAVDRLAEGVGSKEDMEKLFDSVARFHAESYFDHPVAASSIELAPYYDALKGKRRLAERNDELRSQLATVAELARLARRREEEKHAEDLERARRERERVEDARYKAVASRQARLQFIVAVLGVLLAAISLMQIAPQELKSNFSAWTTTIRDVASQIVTLARSEQGSGSGEVKTKGR